MLQALVRLKRTAFRRVKNWLVYRLDAPCRLTARLLPRGKLQARPPLDLTWLSMCGKGHLPYLQHNLYTVARFWDRHPRVHVVSDGSLGVEDMQQALRWWPGDLRVSNIEETLAAAEARGETELLRFCQRSVYGKKFAVMLEEARRGLTLWCDADFLFFGMPPFEENDFRAERVLRISTDPYPSLDPEMTAAYHPEASQPPYANAGFVLLKGDILPPEELNEMIARTANREKIHSFPEQTILAIAARKHGRYFEQSTIGLIDTDQHNLFPKLRGTRWKARHYVFTVRHLFHRDFLYLRWCAARGRPATA